MAGQEDTFSEFCNSLMGILVRLVLNVIGWGMIVWGGILVWSNDRFGMWQRSDPSFGESSRWRALCLWLWRR